MLSVVALLAAGPPPGTAGELQPFTASFTVSWHGLSAGSGQMTLQRLPDGRWSYESLMQAHGLFRLAMPAELRSRSLFTVHDGQVIPEQFTADDGTPSSRKDQQINFDWSKGRVTGTAETKPVDLPTQPGLLDTLSVQVALMHELLAGHTPTHFVLVDKTRIKDYDYSAEGEETLETPLGQHHTIIYRSRRPGADSGTLFWCAPELGYLPLKVEGRDGRSVEWSLTLQTATVGEQVALTPSAK